jgi:transcriptional regulator with XRE-family HTH domain
LKLKITRELKGLTQEQVANLLKIKVQVYQTWERGAHIPRAEMVDKLAKIFEVKPIDILSGIIEDNAVMRSRRKEGLKRKWIYSEPNL